MVLPLAGYSPPTLLSAPKGERLHLRLSTQGRSCTLVKVRGESVQHCLMKGFVWALLLPMYPDAVCELDIGHHYKPDVVSLTEQGAPAFWGECGAVTTTKLGKLAAEFPATHFVVCKWAHSDVSGYAEQLRSELALPPRTAPFELLSIPDNGPAEYISDNGEVSLTRDDLQVVQLAELIGPSL